MRVFRGLRLSVTQVPVDKFSSGISLFLFNLYLQQSILGILEFQSICCTSGCCTTKRHSTEKGESYTPSTSQPLINPYPPFHHHPPSQEAHSEVLVEGVVGNYGDGNEGKLFLHGGGNPGSHCKIFRDRRGGSSPPPAGRISARNLRRRILLSGPTTLQPWEGRHKWLVGRLP